MVSCERRMLPQPKLASYLKLARVQSTLTWKPLALRITKRGQD